jgi:hypothetical protein
MRALRELLVTQGRLLMLEEALQGVMASSRALNGTLYAHWRS